jgi:uncharacterized protein YkwD
MRAGRRTIALLMLLSFAALVVCGTAGAQTRLSSAERQLVDLINKARVRNGRTPLTVSPALCRSAKLHSRDMIARDYFSHSSPRGSTPDSRTRSCGYRAIAGHRWAVGEVIGWGTGANPRTMVQMWMKSSGHRSILLSSRWQHVGPGMVVGTFQGCGSARMYTVDFGCRQ